MDMTGLTLDELTGRSRQERRKKLIDHLFHLCDGTDENVRRWQDWLDRGLVRPEVAYYVLSHALANMADAEAQDAIDKEPLKGLYAQQHAIEAREGLEEDEEFCEGQEPKDWLAVTKKIDKIFLAIETGPMRRYGEHEMAELYLKDYAEFRRRGEAGARMIHAEPELAEVKKIMDEAQAEVLAELCKKKRLEKENSQHGHENG